MTDDLISRAEAMKELQMCAEYYKFAHEAHGFATVEWCENLIPGRKAMEILRNLPAVDAEPEWIPVSEKLPDEFDEYMCTCIDKYTARLYTSAVEFCPAKKNPWVTGATVIAWMEHPKPYEAKK